MLKQFINSIEHKEVKFFVATPCWAYAITFIYSIFFSYEDLSYILNALLSQAIMEILLIQNSIHRKNMYFSLKSTHISLIIFSA